jgi:hypothetical protein
MRQSLSSSRLRSVSNYLTTDNVLAFAVARGWLELSPDAQSVRVTNEGSRLME